MSFFRKATHASIKAITRYYSWARGLRNKRARLTATFAPPVIILGLIGASVVSEEPSQKVAEPQPERIETASAKKVEEPLATEVKAPDATYPITVVKTGEDFQNTYEGELKVYSGKTVIEATWKPECGPAASVDYQTQKFTYTFASGSSEIEIQNNYSDCLGNEGITTDNYPYQVDTDGTIRADLVETDGYLIRKDFIIITGGPAPEGETVSEVDVKPTANDDYHAEPLYAAEPEQEPQTEKVEEVYTEPAAPAVYYSTCGEYNDAGLGNFTPADPEYTSKRDRDGDGVACEF